FENLILFIEFPIGCYGILQIISSANNLRNLRNLREIFFPQITQIAQMRRGFFMEPNPQYVFLRIKSRCFTGCWKYWMHYLHSIINFVIRIMITQGLLTFSEINTGENY